MSLSRVYFCLVFALASVAPASHAISFCDDPLTTLKVSAEVDKDQRTKLKQITDELNGLGLRYLMDSFNEGLVEVRVLPRKIPLQKHVSSRVSWLGQRQLILRNLNWRSESERQLAVWRVAEALFRVELKKSLWSLRSILPDVGLDKNAGTSWWMTVLNIPGDWHNNRVAQVIHLQRDLYQLLEALPEVKPEDVLKADDPGRHWLMNSLWLRDMTQKIFPNLSDRELLNEEGREAWEHGVRQRHSRSVALNYFLDVVRRSLVIGGLVAMPTAALDIHRSFDPMRSPMMIQAMSMAEDLDPKEVAYAVGKRISLETELSAERGAISPNLKRIEYLNSQLREHMNKYQFLERMPLPDIHRR